MLQLILEWRMVMIMNHWVNQLLSLFLWEAYQHNGVHLHNICQSLLYCCELLILVWCFIMLSICTHQIPRHLAIGVADIGELDSYSLYHFIYVLWAKLHAILCGYMRTKGPWIPKGLNLVISSLCETEFSLCQDTQNPQ